MSDASDDLGPFIACPSGVVVRMLAVNLETSTQDLGEQAINTSGRPTTHRARPAPPCEADRVALADAVRLVARLLVAQAATRRGPDAAGPLRQDVAGADHLLRL